MRVGALFVARPDRGRPKALANVSRVVILAGALAIGLSGCAWISRASVSDSGEPAEFSTPSFSPPAISGDGRYIAFDTWAGNLVSSAEDGGVLVRDTRGGTTTAVSVRVDGTVDDFADTPAISGDGRYVAFVSDDKDLVPGGNGNFYQVFLRDRVTGVTSRISTKINGNQGTDDSGSPSLSNDGRYIAFESDSPGFVVGDKNDWTDVFVRDRVTNTTQRVSLTSTGAEADTGGEDPSISGTGAVVAFTSGEALVPSDTNDLDDIYVRNVATNTTKLVSVATNGTQTNGASRSPAISADGRFVAFTSVATNLDGIADTNNAPDVFVRDLLTGATQRASLNASGGLAHGIAAAPSISGDGRFVAYQTTASDAIEADTNGVVDAYVFDRASATTSRVSTDQLGTELPEGGIAPVLSADGQSVTFASAAQIMGQTLSTTRQLYVRVTVPGATPR